MGAAFRGPGYHQVQDSHAHGHAIRHLIEHARLRPIGHVRRNLNPAIDGPGMEITPDVADGPQSCVLDQVTNGVAVRMAILYLVIAGASESGAHPALEARAAPSEESSKKTKESANAGD